MPTDLLDRGRSAFARRAWDGAWRALDEADRRSPLAVEDLERLGTSAALSGRDAEMVAAFERLHAALAEAEPERAARVAFGIGLRLGAVGEAARAAGWMGRARRLVEGRDCVEHGYLQIPDVFRRLAASDLDGAVVAAEAAVAVAVRFREADLGAIARGLLGKALVRLGRVPAGLAMMDEAMVAVATGEVSPVYCGIVYCNVIACCQSVYAVERAREWTGALSAWCDAQPELVPFSGACLVHRAEILRLGGAWPGALEEARRAAERLAGSRDVWQLADAHYERAEVHRLRDERAAAEEGYRVTGELGGEPQPGLAQLRLAQGRVDAACSGLRRVLDGTRDPLRRARFLPASVEVCLAAGDVDAAASAAAELGDLARTYGTALLGALAAEAAGTVALARGDARAALEPLRDAFRTWQQLGAPYYAARARVLLARACDDQGDAEGATLHREAARRCFVELGARGALADAPDPAPTHGLTPRELEVLRHVAAGRTNKAIAARLFVSIKTVDRHVSNLFAKLGVSSRSGATAWAYEHGLVARG